HDGRERCAVAHMQMPVVGPGDGDALSHGQNSRTREKGALGAFQDEAGQPVGSGFGPQCWRIFDRNSFARGERASGSPKNSWRVQSSTILPASMKITRWLTFLAKPISCVTHI